MHTRGPPPKGNMAAVSSTALGVISSQRDASQRSPASIGESAACTSSSAGMSVRTAPSSRPCVTSVEVQFIVRSLLVGLRDAGRNKEEDDAVVEGGEAVSEDIDPGSVELGH